jgi:hypothetical protein
MKGILLVFDVVHLDLVVVQSRLLGLGRLLQFLDLGPDLLLLCLSIFQASARTLN